MLEYIEDLFIEIVSCIIYFLITTYYLLLLNNLNKILLLKEQNGVGNFELVQYNGYQPIIYFLYAFVLAIIGIIFIIYLFKRIRYKNKIGCIILMICIFILLVVIANMITIPILKIIFSVTVTGLLGLYSLSSRT